MRALTIWQPWCWCITDVPERWAKRVENRTWPPPAGMIGHEIALHAGRRYDDDAAAQILEVFGLAVPAPQEIPRGTIVGVARIVTVITESIDPWFGGPVGWVLDNVRRLEQPIQCRGAQGLWTLPPDVESLVREQTGLLPAPVSDTLGASGRLQAGGV